MFKDELIISQINDVKKEINDFIESLKVYSEDNGYNKLDQNDISFFRNVSKQIVFLKYIYELTMNYYPIKVLISDYYYYIISLIKNEQRYVYVNERSIIENYLRLIIGVTVEQDHITSNTFEILKSNKQEYLLNNDDFSLIKSEYTESCGYVHGSKLLETSLSYVFNECFCKKVTLKNRTKYYHKMSNMIKLFNKMLIIKFSECISDSFHRKKLYWLI